MAYRDEEESILEELAEIEEADEENCRGLDWEDIPEVREEERGEVMRRGELECTQNILDYQTYFLQQYSPQLSKQHWETSIDRIQSCQLAADAIHNVARDKLTTSLNLLLGSNLDNYILLK